MKLIFNLDKEPQALLHVIGLGGGGCNAVDAVYAKNLPGIRCIACDTNQKSLEKRLVSETLLLGPLSTQGIGTGSNPIKGEAALRESTAELELLFASKPKIVFIVFGLGGGTGSGAAAALAQLAKKNKALTVGVATLPFAFEGQKRNTNARNALAELNDSCDTLILIKNDKLRELGPELKLEEAFAKADEVLATAVQCIVDIVNFHGTINLDINDVITVMQNAGIALIGSGIATGKDRAVKAMELALDSPLLDKKLSKNNDLLVNVSGNKESISLDEMQEMINYLHSQLSDINQLIWGYVADENLGQTLKVSVIITGFTYSE